MKTRDKEIRDLVIKVRGYYDGIDERLTDALKGIFRRLDEPDHIPDAGKKVDSSELNWFDEESRKSFNAREEKLRADSTWPNTNWYRDDEFCKMYREACVRLERSEEARLLSYKEREKLMEENKQLQAKLEAAKKRENYVECLEAGLRDRDTKLKVAFEVISMLKEKGIG